MQPSSATKATLKEIKDHLLSDTQNNNYLYDTEEQTNFMVQKPWRNNLLFFNSIAFSYKVFLKMLNHTNEGGSIEVMGLLLGKIKLNRSFVVLDSLSLPVEGTETRVNAQQQGYEFMITFLSNLKLSAFNYNVIGWYHSHPNYGCWLSGIDVQTQQLNQRHQDPFVAVVLDPIRSIKEERLVIDAFRTLPQQQENENSNNTSIINTIKKPNKLPQNKEHEFGIHTKKYYQLDISYFESSIDRAIIKSSTINNKNWKVFFSHNNNQGNHHLQKEFDKLNTKFKDLAQKSVRNPKKEFSNELNNLMTLS